MDTIRVYDGFDMTYLQHGDTIMVSEWKFARLLDVIRSMNQELAYYDRQLMYTERNVALCDSMGKEMEKMAGVWKERSIMYRDMYQHTVDDAHKLHGMVKDCVSIAKEDRRRGRVQGIVYGAVGGLVVGLITAAVILK